jgi:hypothetical protein
VFYLDFERVGDGPAAISGASYVPIWVRDVDARDTSRQDFTIMPVAQTLWRAGTGDRDDLRDRDIERLRQVQSDVTHMLSGAPISVADMAEEYPITRLRTIDQFPGLPLWGTLPWR